MDRVRTLAIAFLLSLYPGLGCATPPRTPAEEPSPPTQSRAAQAQSELRAKVEALLARGGSAQDFNALGKDGLRVLEQIFNDPATQPDRRGRALAAMGQLDQPEAAARLLAVLKDARVDPRYRAQAAAVLARRGAPELGAALKAALADPDPKVRGAVARALGDAGGDEIRAALEERLGEEEDPAVRELIQQALTRLQP